MKKIAVILIVTMLFSVVFGSNTVSASSADGQENTDQYSAGSLLEQYSTAEIVAMYPEFSEHLASELRVYSTDISVRDYDLYKDSIGAIYFSVLCENPDIFYVISTRFQTTATYETGKVVSIRPEYYFNIEDIPARIDDFNRSADNILSGVDSSWSDVIKARYIHDMLAHYTEYDTKYERIDDSDYELFRVQMRIYSSYGALVDNNAVCEGYSLAYKYLLSKVGVKCYYIQSQKNHHSWNMVEMNGKVYHVDITHDDPTYDNLGRVYHSNFFKSDAWIKNDGNSEHSDWTTNLKADDTTYDNAWWNDVSTMIYRYNGYEYYINQSYTSSIYAALIRRNTSTGAEETLSILKTRWKVKDIPNAFWERAFCYLTSDGQYLYYNDTSSVYRMGINSTTQENVYTKPSNISNDIYGLAFRPNGQLYATIKASPNDKDILYKLNIQAQTPTNPTESTEPTGSTETTETQQDTTGATETQDNTGATEPQESTGTATEPTSETVTQPTATEPITAAPTQPTTAAPLPVVKKSMTVYIKRTIKLSLKPAGTYKYSTNDSKKATVSSKGVITTKKAGKAIITAKGKSVIFKITLTIKNPRLNVTKKTIKKKKSFTLKVIGGSGKITYIVANKKIITINKKGKVTGKKKGTTTITVKVCGRTLKCKVTVKK